MKKTLLSFLIPLIMGTGCASNLTQSSSQTPAQRRGYATVEEAMEVLGVKDPSVIQNINGYKMHIGTAINMGGLVTLRARADSTSHYDYSQQDILDQTLEEADTDGDMIIKGNERKVISKTIYDEVIEGN